LPIKISLDQEILHKMPSPKIYQKLCHCLSYSSLLSYYSVIACTLFVGLMAPQFCRQIIC